MKQKSGNVPDIYVVVLPEGATDLYQQVKQYVPSTYSCLFIDEWPPQASPIARLALLRNVSRLRSASGRSLSTTQTLCSSTYFPNPLPLSSLTLLRVNVKLGGVNAVPEARSVPMLSDPQNPAIIIGADVIHPAPGVENKPSFTSMVANIDPTYSRYIAISKVQKSRQEIIDDTEEMVKVGAFLRVHDACSQSL